MLHGTLSAESRSTQPETTSKSNNNRSSSVKDVTNLDRVDMRSVSRDGNVESCNDCSRISIVEESDGTEVEDEEASHSWAWAHAFHSSNDRIPRLLGRFVILVELSKMVASMSLRVFSGVVNMIDDAVLACGCALVGVEEGVSWITLCLTEGPESLSHAEDDNFVCDGALATRKADEEDSIVPRVEGDSCVGPVLPRPRFRPRRVAVMIERENRKRDCVEIMLRTR